MVKSMTVTQLEKALKSVRENDKITAAEQKAQTRRLRRKIRRVKAGKVVLEINGQGLKVGEDAKPKTKAKAKVSVKAAAKPKPKPKPKAKAKPAVAPKLRPSSTIDESDLWEESEGEETVAD